MGGNTTHMQMPPSPSLSDSEEHLTLTCSNRKSLNKEGRKAYSWWPSSRLVKSLLEGEAICCHGSLPSTVESGHSFPEWRILASYCHRYKKPHVSNELIISVSYLNIIMTTYPVVVIWQQTDFRIRHLISALLLSVNSHINQSRRQFDSFDLTSFNQV